MGAKCEEKGRVPLLSTADLYVALCSGFALTYFVGVQYEIDLSNVISFM